MGINFDFITLIHQASITDWIQAVAAVLAVIGTVLTLWKLYQRDEQKQAMIGELQQQTKHFGQQVEQLGAQVFQLKNIHEAIAEGIRIMAKNQELDRTIHKIKIRPEFEFELSMLKAGHTEVEVTLKNRGGDAQGIRARFSQAPVSVPPYVRQGEELILNIRSSEKLDINDLNLVLEFEDREGEAYVQRLSFSPGAHHLTSPEPLSKP